ncbi:MAG: response regulator transcription factor [Candidatus Latescibacteria bacterium]|nr:response regulator transcription factor [Candidatus Latescibacterota bacterium]
MVDRKSAARSEIVRFLQDEPFEIVTAENGGEGLEMLRRRDIDLAVVEARVKEQDWTTLLRGIKAAEIRTEMLLVTSVRTPTSGGKRVHRAYSIGALDKPIERDSFLANINRTLPLQDSWKRRLESFLEDNYKNPELRFEDVERHFRFSRTYGYRMFKQHLGESFSVRLRKIRLAKAEEALKNTTASVSEIAYQCGFASLSTFSKVFKAKFGRNPTTYRRNWKLGQI